MKFKCSTCSKNYVFPTEKVKKGLKFRCKSCSEIIDVYKAGVLFEKNSQKPDYLWYFLKDGTQQGPLSTEAISSSFKVGALEASTLMWREVFGKNWLQLRETEIYVDEQTPESKKIVSGPPPIPKPKKTVESLVLDKSTEKVSPFSASISPAPEIQNETVSTSPKKKLDQVEVGKKREPAISDEVDRNSKSSARLDFKQLFQDKKLLVVVVGLFGLIVFVVGVLVVIFVLVTNYNGTKGESVDNSSGKTGEISKPKYKSLKEELLAEIKCSEPGFVPSEYVFEEQISCVKDGSAHGPYVFIVDNKIRELGVVEGDWYCGLIRCYSEKGELSNCRDSSLDQQESGCENWGMFHKCPDCKSLKINNELVTEYVQTFSDNELIKHTVGRGIAGEHTSIEFSRLLTVLPENSSIPKREGETDLAYHRRIQMTKAAREEMIFSWSFYCTDCRGHNTELNKWVRDNGLTMKNWTCVVNDVDVKTHVYCSVFNLDKYDYVAILAGKSSYQFTSGLKKGDKFRIKKMRNLFVDGGVVHVTISKSDYEDLK